MSKDSMGTIIWEPCTCGGVSKTYSNGLEHCTHCGKLILCRYKPYPDSEGYCDLASTHRGPHRYLVRKV